MEKEFCKANGIVRVVFCTVAFGVGVDVKGAQLVIHLGLTSALDDYLQECGRVGRDTNQMSHAVLLKYKRCTRSKNISKPMKDYIKNTSECRRVILMKAFSKNPTKGDIGLACCDICAKTCTCKCCCSAPNCNYSDQLLCQVAEYMLPIYLILPMPLQVRMKTVMKKYITWFQTKLVLKLKGSCLNTELTS